jgi:hypothetical protein
MNREKRTPRDACENAESIINNPTRGEDRTITKNARAKTPKSTIGMMPI